MQEIARAPLRHDPFPHVFVENIFPPAFYAEVQRRMLDDGAYMRLVDTGRVAAAYSPARRCLFPSHVEGPLADSEAKRFWADLFSAYNTPEFAALWLSIFQPQIAARLDAGQVPAGLPSGPVQAYHEIFLMRDGESYSLSPHTDSPVKMVSVLFYLPADDGRPDLGTSLYKPTRPGFTSDGSRHLPREDFQLVATMPYRPNCLFAFPRLENSFHGVEGHIAHQRDVLLFDIKFALEKPDDGSLRRT